MIGIDSGANTVYVTLKEKVTLDSPVYVFVIVNNQTLKKYMVTNTDLSTSTAIRNKFTITQVASPTWTSGQIYLDNYGDHTYYAYECSDIAMLDYNTVVNTDINDYIPTYFTTLLETGVLVFNQPAPTNHTYKEVETAGKAYVPSV